MTKPLNLLILDLNQEAGLVHRRKWSNPDRVDWIVAKQTSFTVLHFQSGLGFFVAMENRSRYIYRLFPAKYHLQRIIFVPLLFVMFCFDIVIVTLCSPCTFSSSTDAALSDTRWSGGGDRRFWEFKGLLLSVLVIALYLQRPVLSIYEIHTSPGHRQQVLTWDGAHACLNNALNLCFKWF